MTVASREIFFVLCILKNTDDECEGRGGIGVSDRRMQVDIVTYSVDNKSCQGAKAITTWPRALSGKSRAFPFADIASRKSSLKGELN